jgi:hypothetical protein
MTEAELLGILVEVKKEEQAEAERFPLAHPGNLSFARARALVLNPALWQDQEREHVRQCGSCARLVEGMERAIPHPSWWQLLLRRLGRLSADEALVLRYHLEDGQCQRCLRRLGQSVWLRTLAGLLDSGQRTLDQVRALAEGVASAAGSLRLAGDFSAETQAPFHLHAARPDKSLTVTVRRIDEGTSGGRLVVTVRTPRADWAGRTVHVEILGKGEPLTAAVVLDRCDEAGCAGQYRFPEPYAVLAPRLGDAPDLTAALTDTPPAATA